MIPTKIVLSGQEGSQSIEGLRLTGIPTRGDVINYHSDIDNFGESVRVNSITHDIHISEDGKTHHQIIIYGSQC